MRWRLIWGLCWLIGSSPVLAQTVTVTTTADVVVDGDGLCGLREAISAANAGIAGADCGGMTGIDTIRVPAGTYTLALPGADEDDNATGDLDLRADFRLEGAGVGQTVLDAAGLDRVLHIHLNQTVEIADLTITGGRTPDAAAGANARPGGGLLNVGTLTLSGVRVAGNATGHGGDSTAGTAGNGGRGGGIYNARVLTITNSTIAGNATGNGGEGGTFGGEGGRGGGLLNAGELTLTNSTFSSNTTGDGGRGGDFSDGSDGGFGGDGGHGGGLLTLGSTIGIVIASATVVNSTISGNTTGSGGAGGNGAVGGEGGHGGGGAGVQHLSIGTTTLVHTTVANNTTGAGAAEGTGTGGTDGEAGTDGSGPGVDLRSGTLVLRNTLVADNRTPAGSRDCGGTLTSEGYNLIEVIPGGCSLTGNLTGNLTNTDPALAALAADDHATATHALGPASPALDQIPAGTNGCGIDPTTDQRGTSRPQANGATACDIGAYERPADLPVAFLHVAAQADGAAVMLRWQIAPAAMLEGFWIEQRTPAGGSWHRAAWVAAQPGAAYHHRFAALPAGTYRFRLRQVDLDGAFAYSPAVTVAVQPTSATLAPPFPNPLQTHAEIVLTVATAQQVRVAVFDALGREIAVVFEGGLPAGTAQTLRLDAGGWAAGRYWLRAEGTTFQQVRPLLILR